MKSDKIIQIPAEHRLSHIYAGYFSLYNTEWTKFVGWYDCRESLDYRFQERPAARKILFAQTNLNFVKLHSFWIELERMLKIRKKSVFFATKCDHIIMIRMSDWWFKNPARRSLMSLFLRAAAIHYDGKDFNTFFTFGYARDRKRVIEWFLGGHTVLKLPKGVRWHSGFVDFFTPKTKGGVNYKKWLVKK